MKVTIELSARDLRIIAAYVGLVDPPDLVQAKDYIEAAVRSCLDQDQCYLKARTDRARIRARILGSQVQP